MIQFSLAHETIIRIENAVDYDDTAQH